MSQSTKSVGAETDVHHGLLQGVWIADAANESNHSRCISLRQGYGPTLANRL